MKSILVIVFYPFAVIYGCFVEIRLLLYKVGVFKISRTPVFSIGIGNITVGGTGKTPHVEYLLRKYIHTHQLATLSRGYGRKTKGFLANFRVARYTKAINLKLIDTIGKFNNI